MLLDWAYNVLCTALFAECALVLLLVLPMPSNQIRGALTRAVIALWEAALLRNAFLIILLLDAFFFVITLHELSNPMHAFWAGPHTIDINCERRLDIFREERNAFVTGFSLFMSLILRRLCDIQSKLHEARVYEKAVQKTTLAHGVPMGVPVKTHFE